MGRSRWFDPDKYIGEKYGQLTLISLNEIKTYKSTLKNGKEVNSYSYLFNCRCDCGKEFIAALNNIRRKKQVSCGCHKDRMTAQRNFKHGLKHTRLHRIWWQMKQRCENEKSHAYDNYGGRGITFHEPWNDFIVFHEWAFKNGYEEHLSIDRIDNDGNYVPNNCRWVNQFIQANNKRNNRLITFNNKTLTVAQWSRKIGIKYQTLLRRLDSPNWTVEQALLTPLGGKK